MDQISMPITESIGLHILVALTFIFNTLPKMRFKGMSSYMVSYRTYGSNSTFR